MATRKRKSSPEPAPPPVKRSRKPPPVNTGGRPRLPGGLKTVTVTAVVPDTMRTAIEREAAKAGMSVSSWTREILKRGLGEGWVSEDAAERRRQLDEAVEAVWVAARYLAAQRGE